MSRVLDSAGLALGLVALLGCDDLGHNPSDPSRNTIDRFLLLQPEEDSAGVGLRAPIQLVATVTKDAAGEQCTFSSISGSFAASAVQATATATVDVNGQAAVAWFPSTTAGAARIAARVGTVAGDTVVTVTAVPDVDLTGVPTAVSAGQTVQARVQIDQRWAGHAVELRVPDGRLEALGPAESDLSEGTRILPLLDQMGHADFLLSAPAAAGPIVLTGSILGTVRSLTIQIQ